MALRIENLRAGLPFGAASLVLRIFLLVSAVVGQVYGQVGAGPIVREIVIEYVGPETISRERVMANLATAVGQPFSQFTVEQDLQALYATGLVSNVRIFAEPVPGGAKVTVLLQGRPTVSAVRIEGASRIAERRVRRDITLKPGEPLAEEKVEADRQAILKLYRDRNFTDVKVEAVVRREERANTADVTYRIFEGDRLIVREINFIGNENVSAKDLRKAMPTKTRNLLYLFNKSGRLLPEQVEEDKAAIRSVYQSRGFADAAVTDYQVRPLASGKGVALEITVREGLQYSVSGVSIEGATVETPENLMGLLKMGAGSLYTPQGLRDDLKALRDFYGTRGFVDLVLVPEVLPSGEGSVAITYQLDEGVQSYVNLVNIQGNTRTKDRVIRRELALKPGDLFDTLLLDVSRQRLENLNYFSRVDAVPSSTLIPGRKDLNIIVEEKRTGSFNFGAGFSTIDSLVGFAELQQANFDLFNFPRFTGGGQRLRIRGQYGLERSDFVMSFTEPWFLGYKLSFGVEGYYREASFLSAVYNQRNYGSAFQLRRPVVSSLSAGLEYRIENVEIYDVDTRDAGVVIRESAGTYTRSAILGSLVWDTRDSLFLTRRGELIEFTPLVAGGFLGGDVEIYGVNVEVSKFIPLIWDMIVLLRGQVAVTDTWDGAEEVPIFDRLYLGGANNMRGFDFRDVGPKDQFGNPIGGNSLAYATAELTFPIIPRVRGAVFTDWGFVNAGAWDWDTSNLNADFGFGLRLDLPIGPLRVDYGIPFLTDDFNGGPGKFNFNIGYQF